jgi:M6 family metalloprotease-like protein
MRSSNSALAAICHTLLTILLRNPCNGRGLLLPVILSPAVGMSPNPNSYVERNKDGSVTPPIYLVGNWEIGGFKTVQEVTASGYTVSKVHGNYEYMEFDQTTDTMISSKLVVGKDNPKVTASRASGKMLTTYEHEILRTNAKTKNETLFQRSMAASHTEEINAHESPRLQGSHVVRRRMAAVVGKKKNLMIPFRFSDHSSRIVPTAEDLSVLMNNQGPHSTLCPTGSVRDVFLASSYNQLDLNTTVSPWVTLPNTEAYYADGGSGKKSTLAHVMIRDALDALQATGFNFSEFDTDNNGYIDAIGFFHSGYAAEWGGTDSYGAYLIDRIWSHKWALYSLPDGKWTSTSGKKVYNYHISSSLWSTSGYNIGRIGVVAHETAHFFDLPDLYDGSIGKGIGGYCLMANSWGFDNSQYYPPLMSAWSKIQLGWVTPQVISTPGSYNVRQGCEFPDIFMISKNFGSGTEYLLIENRQKCKFDQLLPGPGLAIYHIDDSLTNYTIEGYPGQTGWPENGNHYRVALLQADGNYDLEKGTNRGDGTDLFASPRATWISNSGTSNGLTHPNTKGYYGGIVIETWITIDKISVARVNMSFSIDFTPPTRPPTRGPTKLPTAKPTNLSTRPPTRSPTKLPTAKPTKHPTAMPTRSPTKLPTAKPTNGPTAMPTRSPTKLPTSMPMRIPTKLPSSKPTPLSPTRLPTA